jgi:hypothetical protein
MDSTTARKRTPAKEAQEKEEAAPKKAPAKKAARVPQPVEAAPPPAPTFAPPLTVDRDSGPYRIISALSAVVVLLLVGALVFSLLRISDLNHKNSLRSSALSAANQYAVYLSSYNYTNLDGPTAPWTEVDAHSTPAFQKQFNSTKSTLTSTVQDFHATATGKVLSAGLASLSGSRATIDVFIDQTVTNSAEKPNTQTQPLRVQILLIHQGGKWLISNVEVPS